MAGVSRKQRLEIISALRELRREKRLQGARMTFRDVEEVVWNLPLTRRERFFTRLHDTISSWQGKK